MGAHVLTPPTRPASQQLAKVGGKLAVLGVEIYNPNSSLWHIARPGTWDAPQGSGMDMIAYARALCGRTIATNGYAADWRPADDVLCPVCRGQL